MRRILTALGLSVVLFSGFVADAKAPPFPYQPLDSKEFRPIILDPKIGEIIRTHPPIIVVDSKPKVEVKSTPRPKVATKSVTISTSHSVFGVASWYCKAGVSICHHSYPPGSMVAAACGKLRRAMGSHWRGDIVRVQSGGRSVTVKLVDWCGSTTKLIDLYWEPMRRLGGTGTLPVKVSW